MIATHPNPWHRLLRTTAGVIASLTSTDLMRAMPLLLVHEGGYVDNPVDPGGATNMGVTQATYTAWRALRGLGPRSVRYVTMAEVTAIYRGEYWDRSSCDDLPAGVDYAVFDADVNSGVLAGGRWLQRAVGVVADGIVGVHTLAAARAADPVKTVNAIMDERLAFLQGLSTWSEFGRGWGARVADVRLTSITWATGARPATMLVSHVPGMEQRAYLPV